MWYIMVNGQQYGPITKNELLQRGLTKDSMVWCEGMGNWEVAGNVPELMDIIPSAGAAPYNSQAGYGPQYNAESNKYGQPNQYGGQPNQYGGQPNYGNSGATQPINPGYGQQPYGQAPYGQQPYQNGYGGCATDKSKTTAGLFALLLGGLGVHYFYCGKVAGGFICLLLVLFTCGLWDIIILVQGIMMLTMSQQEFEAKYVCNDKTFPLF